VYGGLAPRERGLGRALNALFYMDLEGKGFDAFRCDRVGSFSLTEMILNQGVGILRQIEAQK
jgi:hypothetical protein